MLAVQAQPFARLQQREDMQRETNGWSVMVLEDEEELRGKILLPGLEREGFEVEGVGSALALYRALSLRSYDVFVVDVGLPDESGFAVVQHLRRLGNAAIIMLTGRGGADDHVHGLEQGADAYLSKPVSVDVLAATIRSVMRRGASTVAMPAPDAAGWRLTAQGWRIATPAGDDVALSRAERLFLALLAEAGGRVVSREAVIGHLSQDEDDFDLHRLEMLIHRLRRKVLAGTGCELPLTTVRGIGYLLLL